MSNPEIDPEQLAALKTPAVFISRCYVNFGRDIIRIACAEFIHSSVLPEYRIAFALSNADADALVELIIRKRQEQAQVYGAGLQTIN